MMLKTGIYNTFFCIAAFVLFLCCGNLEVHAQKQVSFKKRIREGYTAVSKKTGQEAIEVILLDSLSNAKIDISQKAEGYYVCALLQQSINESLNMQAYLKQNLDTVKFYNTILSIYQYSLKSDSLDLKGKFAQKNRKLRTSHRPNIFGGGKFMLQKSRWSDAYPYFDVYLRSLTEDNVSTVSKVAYWAVVCGMNSNKPHHVLAHVDTAIRLAKPSEKAPLVEYKARSLAEIGDSTAFVDLLEESVDSFPGYGYFFLNLMDYYQNHNMIERGIHRTDSLMQADSDRTMYWFAHSMFALAQQDYARCVDMSEECIKRDSANVDAHYNKGISLLNMALAEDDAPTRNSLYRRALEPMEKVRELSPDKVSRWGTPLYRIYLYLNMGNKFEEIDRLLNQQQSDLPSSRQSVSQPREQIPASNEVLVKRLPDM